MNKKRSFRLLTQAAMLIPLLLNACASGTPLPSPSDTAAPTASLPQDTITPSLIARKPSLTPRPTRTLKASPTIEPTKSPPPTLRATVASGSSDTITPEANGGPSFTPEANFELTDTPEPDSGPVDTNTRTPTHVPAEVGMRRANPFPVGQAASVPNWIVQVVSVKRGSEARTALEEANSTSMTPPVNFEYLLVQIKVKCAYADKEQHSISASDFKVTGDRLIGYKPLDVTFPDPPLDYVLQAGETQQGWAGFLVGKYEHNLILAVDEISNDSPDRLRYIALDSGASVSIPDSLAAIQATDNGTTPSQPASRNVKVITNEWEVSVMDVIKGKTASDMVLASPYNLPPDSGMQYIVVKVYVRYRNTEDRPVGIDNYYFTATDSSGTVYDFTSLIDPAPALEATLFPGADYSGYIVVQAEVNASNLALVFQSLDDASGESLRYISLDY